MPKPIAVIAEDDLILRMDSVDLLQAAGYEVLGASTADEAADICESRNEEIVLLLTDVEMPGQMNGLALANKVHKCWPWIEIILCSGRFKPEEGVLPEPVMFLGKPVDVVTLGAKARQTLIDKDLTTAS